LRNQESFSTFHSMAAFGFGGLGFVLRGFADSSMGNMGCTSAHRTASAIT
jgi:hypothetical protein